MVPRWAGDERKEKVGDEKRRGQTRPAEAWTGFSAVRFMKIKR